jgi:lipid-binding SYLF domain-containing protein
LRTLSLQCGWYPRFVFAGLKRCAEGVSGKFDGRLPLTPDRLTSSAAGYLACRLSVREGEPVMRNYRKVWNRIAVVSLATFCLAIASWAQDNQSTPTTTETNQPSAQQDQKDQKENQSGNTAKFDQKATSENGKADTDIGKRMNTAANVLDEIMATPDKGIPKNILSDAKCIAVVPSMVNIALVFGGRHGKGVATCRTPSGWSAPAPIDITGGSWGLQIGGQATDLVMLIMNQKGMDHLLSSKFKVGAEITGAAGPVGRQMEGDTDWKMRAEILSYSRSRGLFAGVDLNGASVKQDKDETAVLYGKVLPFETILSGKVAPPSGSQTFLATIRKYAREVAQEKQGY